MALTSSFSVKIDAKQTTDNEFGTSTDDRLVRLSQSLADGTTPTIGPIKPGGVFFIGAGDAAGIGSVTGASSDELRVTNSAGAGATYQIGILARSA